MRLLLLGHSHWEIDLEGSHFAIFLNLLRHHRIQLPPELNLVEDARKHLTTVLAGTRYARENIGYEKHLLNNILNSTPEQLMWKIRKGCDLRVAPPRIAETLQIIHAAKLRLWETDICTSN